jgi:hypothetical protein
MWRHKQKAQKPKVADDAVSRESRAHRRLKESYREEIMRNTRLWSLSRKDSTTFCGWAEEEYVYPQSALSQGAAYTRARSCEDVYAEQVTRESALAAGDPPVFIFDVAVTSSLGLLYVIEIVKTNPVSQHKKNFLAQHGIPLLIAYVQPPSHKHRSNLPERVTDEDYVRAAEKPAYLYTLRDEARKRAGLCALAPYLSFDDSKMLWEHESRPCTG